MPNVSRKCKCPFYICDDASKIHCEGVTDGTKIILAFKNPELKKLYKIDRCNKLYDCKLCYIYQMLERKYDSL